MHTLIAVEKSICKNSKKLHKVKEINKNACIGSLQK